MLDLDVEGHVLGIEIVGQQEFSIRELIKRGYQVTLTTRPQPA
jgi:uncharacterized protein YuzE